MQTSSTITMMVIRVLSVVQLILGVLFWTGNALNLLMLELVLMIVLVIGLWIMAGLAARAGIQPRLVLLAGVWGILIPVLSMVLMQLRLGQFHWLLHMMHLLAVVGALSLAELLAGELRQRSMPAVPA